MSLFLGKKKFVQDNFSQSKKNVIRGLHYQLKNAQDKLIYVTHGRLLDVIVDLRKSSPTFLNILKFIYQIKIIYNFIYQKDVQMEFYL